MTTLNVLIPIFWVCIIGFVVYGEHHSWWRKSYLLARPYQSPRRQL